MKINLSQLNPGDGFRFQGEATVFKVINKSAFGSTVTKSINHISTRVTYDVVHEEWMNSIPLFEDSGIRHASTGLRDILQEATDTLEESNKKRDAATRKAYSLMLDYNKARAKGSPEERIRCMFGEYLNSDAVAEQISREIGNRYALIKTGE